MAHWSRCARRVLVAACLALQLLAATAGKDLYAVLGISRGADDATIKRNYRNLAKCGSCVRVCCAVQAAHARHLLCDRKWHPVRAG